ncbi:unnamed protein product [Rangifer tarandus platyrhynchus]|uniref:Uncharacterized protein n=1 Tax=Rangifer tarandus platyrhynchus TaxID=3082113 RepID=A0AC59ZSW5_RANTA
MGFHCYGPSATPRDVVSLREDAFSSLRTKKGFWTLGSKRDLECKFQRSAQSWGERVEAAGAERLGTSGEAAALERKIPPWAAPAPSSHSGHSRCASRPSSRRPKVDRVN